MNIVFDKSLQSPSFAPGTYVRLKLENKSDEILNWAFIECDCKEKIETLLNSNNFSNFINTNTLHSIIDNNKQPNYNQTMKMIFYPFPCLLVELMSLQRIYLEYKYYIVVFAYSVNKPLPCLQDPYIVIDMSFRVGACQGIKGEKLGDWNFYTMYTQLAGKIAYIYYRFDLANEEFIKSVKDGEEYLKQRNYFYQATLEVYLKDSYENGNYKMAFEKFKVRYG